MRILTLGILLAALSLSATEAQAAQGGATVVGSVVDAVTQAPIAGATVTLLPAGFGTAPGGSLPQALTDDEGFYALTSVGAGTYRLRAQQFGYVISQDAPTIQVAAGQTLGMPDQRLTRGGVITGRVLDARGNPLPQVMVRAETKRPDTSGRGPASGTPSVQLAATTPTNDIGEFRITGLPAGDIYVSATPRSAPFGGPSLRAGGTIRVTTYYPGVAALADAQVFTLAAGQTIGSLEFTMLSAPSYALSGVVVDEQGAPFTGAIVMLLAPQGAFGSSGSTRTGPGGTFSVNGVAPGVYQVEALIDVTFTTSGGATTVSVGGTTVADINNGIPAAGGIAVAYSPGSISAIQVTVSDRDIEGIKIVVRRPRVR